MEKFKHSAYSPMAQAFCSFFLTAALCSSGKWSSTVRRWCRGERACDSVSEFWMPRCSTSSKPIRAQLQAVVGRGGIHGKATTRGKEMTSAWATAMLEGRDGAADPGSADRF